MEKTKENLKILVVEDQRELYESIESLLMLENYQVEHAENGKVACEHISKNDYDLILSDIRMPVMDGIELLKWCKKNCKIPFVVMTGFSNVLSTNQAKELGANGFIPKPFTADDLLGSIRAVIDQKDS